MDYDNLPEALIFSIQRMSTEDGPGIRTTVFFKGCGLNCGWCHNPESISMKPEFQWFGIRCIHCRLCETNCSEKAVQVNEKEVVVDRALCRRCGKCAEECPANAMELIGTKWKLTDLLDEVKKDRVYFEKSGGGVTLSGGEPMMQPVFALEFLSELKKEGIKTAVDTSGHCNSTDLKSILPFTDLVMFDLKVADADKHKAYTDHSNERIIANLKMIAATISPPKALWIRTPLIPGATASMSNINAIGQLIAGLPSGSVSRWELCSFNNLCKDKFLRMGLEWNYADYDSLTEEEIETYVQAARQSGVQAEIVTWSGTTKINK